MHDSWQEKFRIIQVGMAWRPCVATKPPFAGVQAKSICLDQLNWYHLKACLSTLLGRPSQFLDSRAEASLQNKWLDWCSTPQGGQPTLRYPSKVLFAFDSPESQVFRRPSGVILVSSSPNKSQAPIWPTVPLQGLGLNINHSEVWISAYQVTRSIDFTCPVVPMMVILRNKEPRLPYPFIPDFAAS
jgi:hypothetical protein